MKQIWVGDVDHDLHNPYMLNPIPIEEKIAEWKADHAKMMEEMIYEENKPTVDDLMNDLSELSMQL